MVFSSRLSLVAVVSRSVGASRAGLLRDVVDLPRDVSETFLERFQKSAAHFLGSCAFAETVCAAMKRIRLTESTAITAVGR
jgi:hypothetical protein